MKRNWDIIRNILVSVEEMDVNKRVLHLKDFKGLDQYICSYHVELLFQAKLLDGYISKVISQDKSKQANDFSINKLTWEGHEFLDSIREEKVWKKIKDKFNDTSVSVSFDILKSIAVKSMMEIID